MTPPQSLGNKFSNSEIEDLSILENFTPELQDWWLNEFEESIKKSNCCFTPPQQKAIPHIKNGENTLIASPTGSGKTLASFGSIIDELIRKQKQDALENSVYCLYISPLKSLANDINRNVEKPLTEIQEQNKISDGDQEIRQAIRHGDTKSSERQKMLEKTPHILNTTPETLAILLNSNKFKKKLETVEYIIVDEIHSLADNKRGTHLSVSLERLENMTNKSPVRIGCSATIEPLDEIGQFLAGYTSEGNGREYTIVDTRFVREFDIEVDTPVPNLIEESNSVIQEELYTQLHSLVQNAENTLIFTNTRSGAERILENLRTRYKNYTEENSGCHHGSLSKEKRTQVEEKLKKGDLEFVTSSTSLELGIDMPKLDLVIQIGSPKSISALLQRVGRAGHQLGETVTGRVICLEREDLIECTVMAKKAVEGKIDRIFIPKNAEDVAAQHIYGMAINSVRPVSEVKATLKRAYPFSQYTDTQFKNLLDYLELNYDEFDGKNVYPKIWVDTNDKPTGEHHYEEYEIGEKLLGKRGRLAQMIYMTNLGTIPDSFTCSVVTRTDESWVGSLDEDYLDTLDKGDVFVLGGNRYEYRYRRGSKVYVDETSKRPTVPTWFSEQLPLSFDLGVEVLKFQEEIQTTYNSSETSLKKFLEPFPISNTAASSLKRLYESQKKYLPEPNLQTTEKIIVEEEKDQEEFIRRYYVHSFYGRKVNEGLSRLLAQELADELTVNVNVSVSDQGFTIELPLSKSVELSSYLKGLSSKNLENDLKTAVNGTDLFKRYFRINATRSFLILKNYKGNTKSAKKQQVASEMLLKTAESIENFPVVTETYREILRDKFNLTQIKTILEDIKTGKIDITEHKVTTPSPQMFSLATLSASDVVLAEDESEVLKEFHNRVMEKIEREKDS